MLMDFNHDHGFYCFLELIYNVW